MGQIIKPAIKPAENVNPADYIEAYFDYIRLNFCFDECIKVFGDITGATLWQEYEKYCDNTASAPFVFWHCLLTEDERRKIAEYAYNYRKDFLKK